MIESELFLNILWKKSFFEKIKGIFYDETYDDVEYLTSYSFEAIDRLYQNSNFKLDYTITKAFKNQSYQLTKTCNF